MTINEKDSEIKKKINECYLQIFDRPVDLDALHANFNKIKNGDITIEQLYSRLEKNKARKDRIKFFMMISSPLRVLPDYLIIGEHKCGTSSLFRYMLEHPSFLPPGKKEINYFNREFKKGILWYRSYFPTFLYKLYYQRKNKTKTITGEATTNYLHSQDEVIFRIKKLLPSNKFIAILRNPVDRAYSQYNMYSTKGKELLSFEEALEFEKQKSNQTTKKVNLPEEFELLNDYDYLSRGVYVDNLKRWMNIFPKKQFLILQAEEFNSKPNEVLNRVYKFLDLPAYENKDHKKYNVGYYEKMNPETRKMLLEYYKPHNKRLNEFLGTNFDWD